MRPIHIVITLFLLLLGMQLSAGDAAEADKSEKVRTQEAELQYDLALHYLFEKRLDDKGRELRPDYAEAFKWLKKSAQSGHKKAQRLLGVMYERGRGTPVDPFLAQYWYEKAAEK